MPNQGGWLQDTKPGATSKNLCRRKKKSEYLTTEKKKKHDTDKKRIHNKELKVS